jgi:hypothetical protein
LKYRTEKGQSEYGTKSKEMNESLSSTNGVKFLDWLSEHQLVTKSFDAFKRTVVSL